NAREKLLCTQSIPHPTKVTQFLPQLNHTTLNPKSAAGFVNKSNDCTVGLRISPRLNNGDVGFSSLGQSLRFNNEPSDKKVKGQVNHDVSDEGCHRGRKERNREKRDGVNTQGNRVLSDEGTGGGEKKGGKGKRVEVETIRNGVVLDESACGGRKKGGNRVIVGVKTEENRVGEQRRKGRNGEKRKRNGDEIGKGWTKEQDLALQRAYLTAKPSRHFWKNVSKLVPGKSQQECFDRIHFDNVTPVQLQPQSRAKACHHSFRNFL
ncbi:uncharacterized protein LOC108344291, partial [Vigna angularis]|uniref:uncharacterized protein LOC108344291 n=1 Tax=Phaseolus angularis TaxID=3914 RepID=UPI0022B4CEEF